MLNSHQKTISEILGREPVHPFPARMSPGIALEVCSRFDRRITVLDPMMGSGTVLAVARTRGHRAIGVDIDPLAVLISRVWTTAADPEVIRRKSVEVLRKARTIFSDLRTRDAYPPRADLETRRFVSFWFDDYARRQLTSLATAISRVRSAVVRDALWCAFSRLIITKQSGASRAMDLSHSRPHRTFDRAPTKPFRKFLQAVERVASNCVQTTSRGRGPATLPRLGDARSLPVDGCSIDLVLTSPPYLNAIDYIRCSKFSLVWMGYSIATLRDFRAGSVGTEAGNKSSLEDPLIAEIIKNERLHPTLSARDQAVLGRYIEDMRASIREVVRVLVPDGKAVYVVGENTIRGTYIRNAQIVTALFEASGCQLIERRTRNLPANRRYLPPPSRQTGSAALDARMRREVVLAFQKL